MSDEPAKVLIDLPRKLIVEVSRNRDLKPGRLLKPNGKGKLICARNYAEGRFIFSRYVGELLAEVWLR